MKTYQNPEFEILHYCAEDIIATSAIVDEGQGGPDDTVILP